MSTQHAEEDSTAPLKKQSAHEPKKPRNKQSEGQITAPAKDPAQGPSDKMPKDLSRPPTENRPKEEPAKGPSKEPSMKPYNEPPSEPSKVRIKATPKQQSKETLVEQINEPSKVQSKEQFKDQSKEPRKVTLEGHSDQQSKVTSDAPPKSSPEYRLPKEWLATLSKLPRKSHSKSFPRRAPQALSTTVSQEKSRERVGTSRAASIDTTLRPLQAPDRQNQAGGKYPSLIGDPSLNDAPLWPLYDPNLHRSSLQEQQSTLKSWAHVWDECGEDENVSPRKRTSATTARDGVLSVDTWRPPLLPGPTTPPAKTTPETGFYASGRDVFLLVFTFCLGVSGFWKIPVLVTRHGGAFFVACLVMYALLVQPILYLELVLGQFSSSGVTELYMCFPLFTGVGYMSVAYCFLLAVCQSLREVYAALYLVHGIAEGIPWSRCRDEWTSCYDPDNEFRLCKDGQGNGSATAMLNRGNNASSSLVGVLPLSNASDTVRNLSALCIDASRSSSEAYLLDYVWELSDGASSIGSFKKELFGFLTVLWLALFLLCSRPQIYVREVQKLVALFAVIAFLPFLLECSFNHLSLQALSYSFVPDIKKLTEKQVWLDAAEHTLLSLGTGCGIVILMGSRCKYGTSMERFIILTVAVDIFVCQIISVLTYSWIYKSKLNHKQISSSVPLFFHQLVTLPELVLTCTYPMYCSISAFMALFAAGISAHVFLVHTCTVEVCRTFNFVGDIASRKALLGVCGVAYCVSTLFCTQGGPYFHQIIEQGLTRNLMFIVTMLETLGLIWFYGLKRICFDVEYMLKKPVSPYWMMTWAFTAPTIMIVIFTYHALAVAELDLIMADNEFPRWAKILVGTLSLASVMVLIVFMVRHLVRMDVRDLTPQSLWKAIAPDPDWGPQDAELGFDYNDRLRTLLTAMAGKDKDFPPSIAPQGVVARTRKMTGTSGHVLPSATGVSNVSDSWVSP